MYMENDHLVELYEQIIPFNRNYCGVTDVM